MRRSSEEIPGLRRPTDYERNLACKTLLPDLQKQKKGRGRIASVLAAVFGALLVCDWIAKPGNWTNHVGLLILMLTCLVVSSSMRKHELQLRGMVEALNHGQFLVATGRANQIRSTLGEGSAGTYGQARVTLDNGTALSNWYVLPYRYAVEMERRGTVNNQPVLLVRMSGYPNDRLVPVNDITA